MSQYCEGLKRDPLGPLYGYYLAHKDNNQPDVVRHFGLGLMEEAVRYRWSDGTLAPEVKAQIRLNVMSLAIDGSQPLLTEQTFIKEKVARLFVEVAKREWPGCWDDMDAFLRQLYFKDETGREMALLILRSLCEDVCIYDDAVAGLRMKDLRAGLLVIMASETILKEHYPDGVKGHKNEVTLMVGESGNDGWTVRLATLLQDLLPRCQTETRVLADEKIAVAALKALASSLDWIIISSISSVPIVPLVCHSLLSPSEKIRLAGAECYDVIASRNMTEAEREKIIWPLLDDGGVDLISKAYLAYSEQILQEEAYEFIQKLVQATVNLGEQQLCAKRNAHVPKNLSKLLRLLYSMASHPSVLIASIVSFFWTTILRHETFSKEPAVQSFIPSLLGLYSGHLAKDSKNRWKTDPVYRHFASLDFDSTVEFQDRALQIFQRAVDVIRLGVPVMPLDAFIWVANRVAEVLKINFTPDLNVKETTQYKSFDGTLTLMEVTISSLSDTISDSSHEQSGQIVNAMNSLLSILIEYDSKSPSALERILVSFPSFTDMFKVDSTLLFSCLDKLFKAVEYPIPDKTAKDDTRVGDRAAITLVKFGRAIPDTLHPIYGEIESAIQQLIVRNVIPQGLRKTLESFLLVIAFNTTMPLDRVMIFNKVTQPVLAGFQSSELQEALSDPRKFMAFIGVDELSDAFKLSPSPQEVGTLKGVITQRRAKLSRSIETLHTFMKETINIDDDQTLDLWSSNLDSILPNLFSTIRCLNAICDEKLWVDLSPELSRLRTLSPEEKTSMVTGKAVPITASMDPASLGVAKLVSDLKIWLAVLRDQSYRTLTQISLLGPAFYSRPSLQITLEQSLFDHVDCLSNRQLRLLIDHAVQPIVVNCPEYFMDSVLSHLLMVLFPYLDQRLLNDWRLASEEGLQMDEKDDLEDLDVTDEIVKEIMLRDLTRYVAGFVFSILDYGKQKPTNQAIATHSYGQAAGGADTTAITRKEITPLALFILSRETTAQSVIPLICHILTFKDTRSCTRSAETAQRVLAALVQNYPGSKVIIGAFSTMVLQAAMEALRDPYHQEGQEKLIQLITEVYVEVRAFDEAPKHVFQQSLGTNSQRLEVAYKTSTAFEQELSVTTVNKTKLALVRNFLQSIIGVAKSEWFKQKELGDKPTPSRTIAGKYERPSQSALDSNEHEDIGDGLASLFDE
ncbi:hypothetical protein BGX20_011587 [Mortierella sp. AD010]|nr:hypothetical protein BGX20_011587 [Mortierella sp. AD010]